MTLVIMSLPFAHAFTCFSKFVYIILCSFTLQADWRKSDRSVDGESQENWRWNSNSREKVASSPSFSHPAGEHPRKLARRLVKIMMQVHECQSWQPLLRHPVSEIQFDSPQNFRAKQVVKNNRRSDGGGGGGLDPHPPQWRGPGFFFFFRQNTSCIRKPQVISMGGGGGGAPPPTPSPTNGSATVYFFFLRTL